MNSKHQTLLLFGAVVLCVIIPVSAYAETGIISSIITDDTVLIAMGITIVGVALKAVFAVLKHGTKAYDYRMTSVSLILGFLVSLQLVATSIEHLPVDASATTYLIIMVGEILTVMGIDSGAKAVGQKLGLAKKLKEKENETQ